MIKLRTVSRLRKDALRLVFPLAITMSTTITWAGDVNNPANDSLLAMSAQRQADILGKIAGEECKGKTAFYQGTMKDMPQPKGDRRPQLPVPPANENDAFGMSCVRTAAVIASRCIRTAATTWWTVVP